MSNDLDLKQDYIPFSKTLNRAEQLFLENQYREALEEIDELWELVEEKIEDR